MRKINSGLLITIITALVILLFAGWAAGGEQMQYAREEAVSAQTFQILKERAESGYFIVGVDDYSLFFTRMVYEYDVVVGRYTPPQFEKYLNKRGRNRWELVDQQVIPLQGNPAIDVRDGRRKHFFQYISVFKRAIADFSKEDVLLLPKYTGN